MTTLSQVDLSPIILLGFLAYIIFLRIRARWRLRGTGVNRTKGSFVFWTGIVAASALLIGFGGFEMVKVITMAFPEIVLWATTFEITLIIDLFLATTLVSTSGTFRASWTAFKMKVWSVKSKIANCLNTLSG